MTKLKAKWVRTCQECGTKVLTETIPSEEKRRSLAYANAKCKHCKSMGLDYGKEIEDFLDEHRH